MLARLIPACGYVHGDKPTSIDAGIYGFIANIHFYDIDTPLKQVRRVASKSRAPLRGNSRGSQQVGKCDNAL